MARGTGLHGPVPAARGAPATRWPGACLFSVARRAAAHDPQGNSGPVSWESRGPPCAFAAGIAGSSALLRACPIRAPISLQRLLCSIVFSLGGLSLSWLHTPAFAPQAIVDLTGICTPMGKP